ncbi:hypothetical protein [Campylobacter geochelonis]|uniref:Uncharacterized protein n=1 Tax=Campylobacter geochelonis TaxID=1780362 RepID=A0A128EB88_9BACT|nr:hypothetical protein [Campylobacter geochelonis]QKF70472.1 hypothetical protein CGEO_0132 [Campylobacter geochelonis]CZE46215.1 Uncharacterised protein [Campylobacter geochelonis]
MRTNVKKIYNLLSKIQEAEKAELKAKFALEKIQKNLEQLDAELGILIVQNPSKMVENTSTPVTQSSSF